MNIQPMKAGGETHANVWSHTLKVDPGEWQKLRKDYLATCGWDEANEELQGDQMIVTMRKKNLVVDSGVTNSLDFQFGIGTPSAALTVGVDDGVSNPVAGTTNSTAGSTNRRLVAFDSTPTRASLVVSASGTFTQANVSFVIKRLFLSRATAGTTDSAGDLIAMTDVFTHDNTPFTAWDATYTLEYTGAGS